MNLIKLFPVVTVAAVSLPAASAQAFGIAGNSSYTPSSLLTELSVSNEVQIPDNDTKFTVINPSNLEIGSLFLEGFLGEFGVTENSVYAPVLSYITGFQFLGEEAVFNLNAGQNVLYGSLNESSFAIDSQLSGNITDLDGIFLGTAVGSFSSIQISDQVGSFAIELEGVPFDPNEAVSRSVQGPSLLFGLMGVAISALLRIPKRGSIDHSRT